MEFNMLPQNALNAGRFCIFTGDADGAIYVEDSVNINVIAKLREMGHTVYPISKFGEKKSVAYTVESRREITIERVKDKAKLDLDRGCFGKGVIIERREGGRVLCGGADPRGDGVALGW
ncbi:hypothetical protein SARC_08698 [Sphaeroforma arctica JP610]|uniref:Uncharacterized protein n=1 Tax=Sphaeroforma arctica JP610 TaxID=667725 RepID=A0A0L0FQ08_9EUKA|nr:hypothetical protein SARC_08698 [Sphaeroforma arctica JP610]KNC78887.1 hypothetical protein SARC_08698 [Sphaeroforma arctica JP610]|eukprot:XP_014152789.1 hypothetical protein SARC_08698 [Sphaeroforma arctica JP610]